jgi:hypothetical protein
MTPSRAHRNQPRLEALVILVLVKIALRTVGFRRSYRAFANAAGGRPSVRQLGADGAQHAVQAAQIAHIVSGAAAFLPWRALCLEQSLALCCLLRRHGYPAVVRLGVRPYPFAAHAWVELDGVPLAESPEHLRAFAAFPLFQE